MNKTCIVVTGPTASGKTALAIALARHFNTQIISADSRQCFKEMNIGVARPSETELAAVPHHFIASHSIHQPFNAADFESYALHCAHEIFKTHSVLVMVGGTGLYIKAFCEGLNAIPEVPEEIRANIIETYQQQGMAWLQDAVSAEDPLFFARGEIKNPQRMMRALEVVRATGSSILSFHAALLPKHAFNIIKIGLAPAREELYSRINRRVDDMIQQGLAAEAEALYPYRNLNALQTVGYKEWFSYMDGHISREQAIALIKQNSRHYAKRQLTWLKKDTSIQWFSSSDELEAMLKYLHTRLHTR